MRGRERDAVQQGFMAGDVGVVCASTAFGMGIDKADVRWVVHAEISESLDAYDQEIGRCGGDGEPAEVVLFYRAEDVGLRRFFSGSGQLHLEEIAEVLDTVEHEREPIEPADLGEDRALPPAADDRRLAAREAGAVEVLPSRRIAAAGAPDDAAAIQAAAEAEEKRRSLDRSRVDMMRGYAETESCRRTYVLSYFGEPFSPPCGRCDNCEAGHGGTQAPDDAPFAIGARVTYDRWSDGGVQRYDDAAVIVLFDEVDYKSLALDVVRERGVLAPA